MDRSEVWPAAQSQSGGVLRIYLISWIILCLSVPPLWSDYLDKAQIRSLQRMVGEMGYYHGPVDGRWNAQLKKAVKRLKIPVPRGLEIHEGSRYINRVSNAHGNFLRNLKAQRFFAELGVYDGPRDGRWSEAFQEFIKALQNEKAYLSTGDHISLRFLKILKIEGVLTYGGLITASKSYFLRLLKMQSVEDMIRYCFHKSRFLHDGIVPIYRRFHPLEIDPHHADFLAFMHSIGYRPFLEQESGSAERGFRPIQNEAAAIQLILLSAYRQSLFIRPPYDPRMPAVDFEVKN